LIDADVSNRTQEVYSKGQGAQWSRSRTQAASSAAPSNLCLRRQASKAVVEGGRQTDTEGSRREEQERTAEKDTQTVRVRARGTETINVEQRGS